MLRLLLLVFAVYLVATPNQVQACGTVAQSFWSNVLEADKTQLESFLKSQTCSDAERYAPEQAEPYIAIVLINAIDAGVSEQTIEAAFTQFNCVSTVRRRTAYNRIIEFVGKERFSKICDAEALGRMYIVKASGGANLRRAPSISADKLGAVAEGTLVKDAEPEGEWFFVHSYRGSGYVHQSTLKPYLGES